MDFRFFMGWDVSKDSLNYCLRDASQLDPLHEGQVPNQAAAITRLLQRLSRELDATLIDFAHCVENTGRYTNPLLSVVQPLGLRLWLEDPLHLKRSMGRQKRKTDAVDARNIAEYCRWKHAQATWYEQPSELRLQLRELSTTRTKLVRYKQSLYTSRQAKQAFKLVAPNPVDQQVKQHLIETLETQIDALDAEILRLIEADVTARRKLEIARSVPGIGPKNVMVILAITGLFERIRSARACAAYAGLVPYEYESGTSVRKANRVSRAVSKQLKTALHQGAVFLIVRPSPFQDLYQRLRAKGRTYRQAINAVRNKMIRVLYTCLERDVIYDKKIHAALA